MKIYIIIEGQYDRMIRGVTLSPDIASKVCDMFKNLCLFFEEYETLENEDIRNFLNENLK